MAAYLRIPASKVGFGRKNSVGAWASPSVDDARARKVGIWGERFFWVRNPHEMQRDIDTFQIVEGRVISDVIIKGRAYLNFNQNWRTNFTFSISQSDRRHFERTGFDFAMLGSRRVRGRGWVTLGNGPLIELTHHKQLELLGELTIALYKPPHRPTAPMLAAQRNE